VRAERLLLEYDDDRSGSFEPLADVPDGKFVVLGLISTKRGQLESVVELKRRISDAARYISHDRLGISPQCGFASSILGNNISLAEQQAKLKLDVDAARAIWG